jgi:hypothetical protein
VRIKINDTNGLILKTKDKVCKEDIEIIVDENIGGGVAYDKYTGKFTGNAIIVNGYTVKIKFRTVYGMGITTKLKINSSPSATYDSDVENTATSFDETTIRATFTNVEKVYIWGLAYLIETEEAGDLEETFSLVNNYTQATEVEIKKDCTIMLISSYASTGGSD